ncbi:MAG TPA: DUF1993 domain-containing protein [Polyangiaceae bacterium]|jgi:hypothetical protein|nr:DUF1993 domain-containing protein [Polyangiaceae bacterium]
MSHVHANVVQFTKMLKSLDAWLEKAEGYAKKKNFDAAVLLESRLAPDMLPLVRQIQASCDGAKFYCARLSGKEPPKHPDTEKTLDELHARIRSVVEYCSSFKESDFNGAEERAVPLGFMPGKGVRGKDFITEMNVPNTYFHLCMAYAILRHNGVDIGKTDYIGSLSLIDV